MSGQRADCDAAVFLANVIHVAKAPDVDDVAGLSQAQLHQGQQTMSAGQNFCLVAVALNETQRVFQSFRCDVFELCRNHNALPLPFWTSFQMRSRLNGMSAWRTPKGESASATALASAGVAPIVPASPTPFT